VLRALAPTDLVEID